MYYYFYYFFFFLLGGGGGEEKIKYYYYFFLGGLVFKILGGFWLKGGNLNSTSLFSIGCNASVG